MIDVLDELADSGLEAHTSVVLAYNVDLLVYDKLFRRRLAAAGATSQVVFCDATSYGASLDGVDTRSRIGRAYSVTPVRVEGAFHPKAYLLLGRRRGRLILGTGNASLGGLVRNAEVFGRFEFDEERDAGPHPAFRVVFDLAKRLARGAVPAVREQRRPRLPGRAQGRVDHGQVRPRQHQGSPAGTQCTRGAVGGRAAAAPP